MRQVSGREIGKEKHCPDKYWIKKWASFTVARAATIRCNVQIDLVPVLRFPLDYNDRAVATRRSVGHSRKKVGKRG